MNFLFASFSVLLGRPKMIKKICKTAIESVDFLAFFWRAPESQNQPKIARNHPEKWLQKWLPDRRILVVICKIPLRRSIKFGPNFLSQNVVRKIGLQKAVSALENDDFEGAKLAPRSTRIAPNHPEKWLQKWLPDRRILVVICKIPLRRSITFCPNFLSPNPIFFRLRSEIGD